MPAAHVRLPGLPEDVRAALRGLQERLGLAAEFSPEVLAEAERAATAEPVAHVDRRDLELVTIDPPESTDLDQSVRISKAGDGYLVQYAISDVAQFVRSGTELEAETHRRGQTMYAPGARIPLHPTVLSEGAASQLADGRARPALLWEIRLDAEGRHQDASLTRAMVVSRAKLSYAQVLRDLETGAAHPSIELLPTVGKLRQRVEIERGGASLNLPSQEVEQVDGTWELTLRGSNPVEDYNAQISLLTGMVAAEVMLDAKVGILRTLPPAAEDDVARLRSAINAMGVEWRGSVPYPEFLRSLSRNGPRELAAMVQCATLFRGAGYLAFDGVLPTGNLEHGALAAAYAHSTAPLRRLVDRYVLECCHSALNDLAVPDWVHQGLAALPEEMRESNKTASEYERGVLDLAEALVLRDSVGSVYPAVVTQTNAKSGRVRVQITEPALEVSLTAPGVAAGERLQVRLESVDVPAGEVRFAPVA